jgi:hypothetical protein
MDEKTPAETVREASEIALAAAARLYELTGSLLEPERPGDKAFRAVEYIHEAAREIRRQGLWLWGEVEYPREAADDAPVVDG